jgi:hypothetical protein
LLVAVNASGATFVDVLTDLEHLEIDLKLRDGMLETAAGVLLNQVWVLKPGVWVL